MSGNDGILLESGTNEVEILEFVLAGQGFGVNVLKIQAIEQYNPAKVTEIQLSHPAVIGTYNYRDGVISLVDLRNEMELDLDAADTAPLPPADSEAVKAVLEAMPGTEADDADPADADVETRIVLVLEFNEITTGFLVDGVNRIHRVSWDAISPLSSFLASVQARFTGSLNIENREILVLDMERILAEILPAAGNAYEVRQNHDATDDERRAAIPVYLAEDSGTIREVMAKELQHGGYVQLRSFDNGQACHDALVELVDRAKAEQRPLRDLVGIVISDIEMPQMDGLTLCRKLKSDLGADDIPVILFSSLINEQISLKCEAVGADAYLSKPRYEELLARIDALVL